MEPDAGEVAVLCVDDDPDLVETTAIFLERRGDAFTVRTAASPSEGLELLAAGSFDCVVSDYDMPGTNGIEFLEAVRQEYPDLPFVLFTGKGSEAVASEAITAGASDYLRKTGQSGQYELLANRVGNAVERYHAARRAAELDRLRRLSNEVNQALVRATASEEAERRVCDLLSRSDSYVSAWIGGVDADRGRVEPRVWAGTGGTDVADVGFDGAVASRDPWRTALHDGQVVVTDAGDEVSALDPWGDATGSDSDRRVAAVPLAHEDERYGVLVVYADRPRAFGAEEREFLVELGDDLAHVLHSFDVREQLRAERDRRRALFENAPGPVIAGEIPEDGTHYPITDVNAAFEEVFGYDAAAVVGKDVADVVVPDDDVERHERFRERSAAGRPSVAEVERLTATGRRTFIMQVIPYSTDGVDRFYTWYTDVTERERDRRAVEALHTTSSALMDAESPDQVVDIVVDAARDFLEMPVTSVYLAEDGRLVPAKWTEGVEELVGTPPTVSRGAGVAWEVLESGEPQVHEDVSKVGPHVDPDSAVRSELVVSLGDHGVLVADSAEVDAFDETDVSLAQILAAHAGTALDRIERERELREERAFIDQAVDAISDVFYVLDTDGHFLRWNDQVCRTTGYTDDEIESIPAVELFVEEDRERVLGEITETIQDGDGRIEAEVLTKAGERIPHEFVAARLTDVAGEVVGLVGIGRDISDRKAHERKLTALHDVATDLSRSDSIEFVCERIVRASEEILAFDLSVVDLEEDGSLRKAVLSSDIPSEDATQMSVEEEIAGETYRSGQSVLVDDVDAVAAAKPQGPYRSVISIPIGNHGVFQAVAEEPGAFDEADLELAELLVSHAENALDRLDHEQRLERQNERLDEFASIVSHDLRNPLTVANGNLELARQDRDSDHLATVADAHDRMESLIDNLLNLAREGDSATDREDVPLTVAAEQCWAGLETTGATLAVETDRTVRADPGQLRQLLENLFVNATTHGGADVTVTVGDCEDGFYVGDDGPGIRPADRDRVFERGYSASEAGTGFGLHIVERIARAHDWSVSVTDSDAGGARFEIHTDPVADD